MAGQWAIKALGAFGLPVEGAVPAMFSGNISSMHTVMPFSAQFPGLSPMAAIALKQIEAWFPESAPIVSSVVSPATQGSSTW